jgi:hypothetical protein
VQGLLNGLLCAQPPEGLVQGLLTAERATARTTAGRARAGGAARATASTTAGRARARTAERSCCEHNRRKGSCKQGVLSGLLRAQPPEGLVGALRELQGANLGSALPNCKASPRGKCDRLFPTPSLQQPHLFQK